MPEFQYIALDRAGQSLSGSIAISTKQQAIAALAQEGRFVTDISSKSEARLAVAPRARGSRESGAPAAQPLRGRRVPLRMKASMLAQLSTALSAGLALLPALRIIHEQATQPAMRDLAEHLANAVQNGESLSEAFAQQPRVFSPLEVS